MTGFGVAEDRVLQGRLRIEIRTVNHRYFNPQLKLPADLAGVEVELRERLRQLLERGHVTVTARWVESPGPEREVTIDLSRARQVLAAAQQLKKKLKLTVQELTSRANVDEQRLALEIALIADRVDITEELVRFRAHVAAARAALASDHAVGKQLGFLAQELLREVNTMGSKANDARITQSVIAMKGDLEKFREQLENLE